MGFFDNVAIRRYSKIADKVIALEDSMKALSDDELRAKTTYFKEQLASGKTLDDIKVEAFAVAREAARRTIGEFPYKVQIIGSLALHAGDVAEMKTGEGKTLTATMAVYLNALAGKGVHVVTVNEYLSGRDANWMGQIYRFLGLTVGVNLREKTTSEKKEAYLCDITMNPVPLLLFQVVLERALPNILLPIALLKRLKRTLILKLMLKTKQLI